jgi:RNA polymerase sigma factor (sigma-70 family)
MTCRVICNALNMPERFAVSFFQSYGRHTVMPKGAIVGMPNTEPITFQGVNENAADHSRPRPFPVVRATPVPAHAKLTRFEHAVLPHLAAAYNLARWLTRDAHDAEDVVQEAYVRAWAFFDRFHGGDGRAWLLTIVRHTGYTWLQRHRRQEISTAFDTDIASSDQHTVKPWFEGKLDFSPPVTDLAEQGFPLVGGRLEYLDNRPVAVLVYRHQQHVINLFVWPATPGTSAGAQTTVCQGYQLLHWIQGGLQYWAVSNLNLGGLQTFIQAVQQATRRRCQINVPQGHDQACR